MNIPGDFFVFLVNFRSNFLGNFFCFLLVFGRFFQKMTDAYPCPTSVPDDYRRFRPRQRLGTFLAHQLPIPSIIQPIPCATYR